MRRKKTVKMVIILSAVGLFLSEAAVSPVCAAEEGYDSAETESAHEKEKTTEEETEGKNIPIGEEEKAQEENFTEEENSPVRLQVPEKFDIVMDPWEMDGKGQIYSGEYMIKNTSGAKGTLKLTGIAAGIEEDVEVQSDQGDLHTGNGRNLFVEMVINGEDSLTLLPEGTDYEAILEADEGVTLRFAGEMNENAEDGWHDGDVAITVVYDWVPEPEEGSALTAPLQKEDGVEKEKGIGENSADTAVPEDNSQKEEDQPDTVISEDADRKEEDIPDADRSDEGGEKLSDTDMPGDEEGEKGKTPDMDTPDGSKEEGKTNPDEDISGEDGKNVEKNPDADMPENSERIEGNVPDSDTSEESGAGENKTPDSDITENTWKEGQPEEPGIKKEDGNQ